MTVFITSNSFRLKFDLTKNKLYSLKKISKEIIDDIDKPLMIKIYLSGDLPSDFIYLKQYVSNFMFELSKSNDLINYEFIDPDEIMSSGQDILKYLASKNLLPTELDIVSKNEQTKKVIFPGAVVFYEGKESSFNFLQSNVFLSNEQNINNSIQNFEFEFFKCLDNLMKDKKQKIAFLNGNGQLSKNNLNDICYSVMNDYDNLNHFYDIDFIDIKEFEIVNEEINIQKKINDLNKYKAIIIAKPTIKFNILDKFIIDQYLMNGGNLMWLVDGTNGSIDSLNKTDNFIVSSNDLNLNDLFFKYGIRIVNDNIQDLRSSMIPIVTGYNGNIPTQKLFNWPFHVIFKSDNENPISANLDAIKGNFTSSIDTLMRNNIKKSVLINSSKNSRSVLSPYNLSLRIIENPPNEESFLSSNIITGVLLEGKFESLFKNRILPKGQTSFTEISNKSKVIVFSDGDFIKNEFNKRVYPLGYDKYSNYLYTGNKKLILNSVQYLCDDNKLISLRNRTLPLNLIKDKISKRDINILGLINLILPIILFYIFSLLFNQYYRVNYEK